MGFILEMTIMSNTENIIWWEKEEGGGRDLSSVLIQQVFDPLGASYCARYFFVFFSFFAWQTHLS